MSMNQTTDAAEVKAVVVKSLAIDDRARELDADTPLTSIPEFDSLAILDLVLDLERHFDIEFDDEDVTAEVFETIETLAAFVDSRLG
jgi:acyl carrier protein